ncbi:MAG: SpaA isopeptide-forming pilin-related protein, partial [Peptoniphilus sp.]|uniref:SpaA isopeptide-forming pilin-related protein n=1 Tax=Peptoniphilus sp. TaxID=1971214 RepID=UPI00399F20AC
MDNIFKRFTCLLLAFLMVMEVFSPVAALAASLIDEPESQNSTRIEENISGELFNKPAAKAEKTDTRNKEEVHKKTSNKAKETGKAPDLIPAKKTKNDHESMNPAKQTKNDYEILVPAKEKAKPEAKAAEEAKAKEEQAAKEKEDLAKIEKEKQEALRIEAERQAQAARANDAEAAAAEAEYREAHQKRLELEQLLEEKLKEKGLRDQKKQSEKSLNAEESNKLKNTNKEEITEEEEEKGLLEKIKEGLGLTDLQRADKELKKALKNKKNGLEEIQALLISFEDKYDLSREDQAKLMADNTDAFKEFIERHGYENFDPQMFMIQNDAPEEDAKLEISDLYENLMKENRELTEEELEAGLTFYQMPTVSGKDEEGFGFFRSAFRSVGSGSNDLNLKDKKFTIITRYDISNGNGRVKAGQSFTIHLDDKLTVNNDSTLPYIKYKDEVIARPSYDSAKNTITYTLTRDINENIQVPLNIPVDYNIGNITLDDDGTFTVINKVTGIGVNNPPKDLVPQKVDKNGNPAGSIIEPGRNDVTQIVDSSKNYRLDIDSVGNPVIENGEMKGINWVVKIESSKDLKNDLGMKMNFTLVEGSGLEKIESITSSDSTEVINDNAIKGQTGIVDSKHSVINQSTHSYMYSIYTPISNKQAAYVLDISTVLTKDLTNGKPYVGAVRSVMDKGYPKDKVEQVTPTRVGINNRTTIEGKFLSNTNAQWTITDGVCTLDTNNGLPLETRTLEGANIKTGKRVVYGVDSTTGKMVVKEQEKSLTSIPSKEKDPEGTQAVGNIGVYQFTHEVDESTTPHSYTISGVKISRFQDLYIDQHWNLPQGYEKMPAQDINVVDKSGKNLGSVHVETQETGKQRQIIVPNVKYWDINEKGEASPIDYKINQTFPTGNVTHGGKEYKYNENTSYYNYIDKNHFILNSLMEVDNKKPATFKIVKVDSKTGEKLQGASFYLLGAGISVVTDVKGEATFTNIPTGTYTLNETKAPKGYKLDGENKTITISDNGEVSVSGENADFSQPAGKTEVVEHNNSPNWPDYMNAMHYGKITTNKTTNQNEVEFYLYLKPNAPRQGGETDRNTRLDISIPGVNITDVKAYDVSPGFRPYVKSAMEDQTVNNLQFENDVINAKHKYKITGTQNKKDDYTGRIGYQINFPKERFAGDWGFLVKVKANIGQNNSASLYYDWLTNEDTANQTNLQKVVRLSKNTSGPDDKPTITIKNTPFEKKPIEVFKFANTSTNGKRDRLSGAEFVLKDSEGNVIANKITDKDGKASFGEYPEGRYTIEEVKAPDGYEKNGVYFEVEVNESQEVSYKPRFENSSATPQPGQDYFIEKGKEIGGTSKNIVTSVNQWLDYNEGQSYSRGERPNVWEAYRYESLKYHADITLSQSNKGDRFEIQFDPNLDFTQYFAGFPKIRKGGKDIADPYFDYNTNLLTYVFNENTDGGKTTATIDLIGMIPSKYYAKNTGTYPFTITVQPKQTGIAGQKLDKNINAFFDAHDSGNNEPVQNYYFREIYEENGEYYVDVISYYNVIGDRNPYKKVSPKTLNYNWITTNFQGGNIADWVGEGTKPRQVLDRVKIYRTEANVRVINDGPLTTLVNDYMPQSMGFRAEQEPNIYRPVFNTSVDPNKNATISQNGITLVYDKDQINPSGKLIDNKNQPLKLKMPSINNGEGYVIEQRFKIPDIDAFNKKWRAYVMNNGNLKSAFASGANKSFAKGDQTGGETPKYYKEEVGLINKKYTPGQFKIIKSNQSDNSKLAGATFELTDANNNAIYRTSDKNGELSFTNLAPGSYTLKETKAPKDFVKSEKGWSVTVYSDGSVRITQIGILGSNESYFGNNENIIIMPVSNKPSGADFRVYKKDSDGKPLQGAKFVIKNKEGTEVIKSGESNTNGVVEFKDLTQGTYIIEESEAPKGYNKLDKKWVLVIGADGSKKVYNKREKTTGTSLNSILEQPGVNWVDVAGRSLDGWNLYDNRYTGWTGNNVDPFKLGTRIVGINRKDKYVIQRYVINLEAAKIGATSATIHREKPEYPNMDWYSGALNSGEEIQVFKLNKPVTGVISDIRLAEYGATEIKSGVTKDTDNSRFGQPQRLKLTFPATDKPLVIDVKVPYKEESGGVGTGMDWTENGTTYWKSDYYESASV